MITKKDGLITLQCAASRVDCMTDAQFGAWILASCDGDEARAWDMVRDIRAALMQETDWTNTLDGAQRLGERLAAYQQFRQALCDIPQQFERVADIVWPVM